MDKLERINHITDKIKETLLFKNHDYGDSFKKTYKKFGMIAPVVRMGDKYERLCTLINAKQQLVKDESINDTLYDLMGYVILTLAEREGYDDPLNEGD